MPKNIYERMASSPLISSRTYAKGQFPQRTWIAEFTHKNGLVTEYDGARWSVTQQEQDQPHQQQ